MTVNNNEVGVEVYFNEIKVGECFKTDKDDTLNMRITLNGDEQRAVDLAVDLTNGATFPVAKGVKVIPIKAVVTVEGVGK